MFQKGMRPPARVGKRAIVVDTLQWNSAGDETFPIPGASYASARPELQHAVMIEAVENHMPEVIVIDEIGT